MSDWTIEKADKALPTDPADIEAEIAYCEKRLAALKAIKFDAEKQEYPKAVYKEVAKAHAAAPLVVETQVVNSEEELKKLGDGWGDHPAAKADASKDGDGLHDGAPGVLDGTVSDVAAYVATVTDAATLKALKAQERKGKARQGVYDAIDARLAELKENA
jgi:hypothetical protein